MYAFRLALTSMVLLAGCVSPLVHFTSYSNPVFPKEQFETVFKAWRSGSNVPWEVHYKGTAFSEDELVVTSTGQGSLGPRLPSSSNYSLAKPRIP